MRKLFIVLAGGSALVSVPALAQGPATSEPTFTGPRVEAVLGYDINKAGSSVDDDVNEDNNHTTKGLLYGVGLGYDVDLGGAVVGAEAELTDSTAKTGFQNGEFAGFGIGNVKANRDIYVGARVGAKVSPKTLLYVKGGYTNAKFDVRSSDGTTTFRDDLDADGYRVGAGAEYAFNRNTFAKIEYRYSNYKKAEIDLGGTLPDSERFNVDTDRHQIAVAAGWRF